MNSPALSDISLSDDALDAYFATSYVPPSMWPTPPPATPEMGGCLAKSMEGVVEDSFTCPVTGEDLLGPATHLTNLIPPNACQNRPSAPRIAHYLSRSALPIELIAFAACMLDDLTSRFAATWLNACHDIDNPAPTSSLTGTPFPPTLRRSRQPIPVDPELIVLAALSITNSYHQDHSFSKEFWTTVVAERQFSVRQLNVTISAMLADLNYRLEVFTPERVKEALEYMRNASRTVARGKGLEEKELVNETQGLDMGLKMRRERPALKVPIARTSIWMNGQCTPEPSP
ncbi:hypothetical protein BU16DRAFT_554839 [Lophium mytilinum]|uniref:Cyclin N-terminal domain-containing protein n=1 Tax=Lophium mytilinum TaxID=390894 RepID=A0A6A6REF9_9PEZI|nr:hypothetical protein BU16DRAFT_554839 [Lophium mytilinum]